MRYGIFSDIHSNLEALEAVIKAYRRESIDIYLCVGDIVGYAADPSNCIQLVKKISSVVIAGNHDWAAVDLFPIDYFNPVAKRAIIWTKTKLSEEEKRYLGSLSLTYRNDNLSLVHGTLDSPQDFKYMDEVFDAEESFKILENNICFIGHSHISGVFVKDDQNKVYYYEPTHLKLSKNYQYIVNVGSVGQPRDGNPFACYSVFDTEKKEVWIKRVDYDIKSSYKKIIEAGLPVFLAERLYLGR
ncbi:MAG: metallophosphatase family protein [Candidatus Omnitrophica bacterium]|nr:metallophosphatase family protein [Candidatus Omnitrophota bacterium]